MQENEILRYNQGFSGFGPMEQCSNGRYILSEDYDYLQHRFNVLKADLQAAENRERTLRKDNIELRHSAASRVRRLSIDLKYSRKMNRFFAASYALGWIIALVSKQLWHLY